MPEKIMDFDLAAEIVADIAARVGTVGQRSVPVVEDNCHFGSIALMRGGIVRPVQSYAQTRMARRRTHRHMDGPRSGKLLYPDAPVPSQPVYSPSLAASRREVGFDEHLGLEWRSNITLCRDGPQEYVFVPGPDGLWRAFDTYGEASDDFPTQTTEYYLDAARPVTTNEEGIAIRSLIASFDRALSASMAVALQESTRPVQQGE